MAYLNGTAVRADVQQPPIVSQLQSVFASLDDAPLLTALTGPTRRGPKGHPVKALWQCFVAKYVMGLPSTAALIRMLRDNPFIAQACGIASPDAIPHEATFSRFFAKLAKRKYLHLVKDVSRSLVRRHYADLPGFGQRVALDSTTLKAWSNGGKKGKQPKKPTAHGYKPQIGKVSDKDAGWAVKKNTHGKTEFTFGYKLHLLVDCEYELPIAANISPGNTHDQRRASHVLSEARFTMGGKFHPKYTILDKGYSGKPLYRLIRRQYRSTPIMDLNPGHKKLLAELGEQMSTPEWKAIYKQRTAIERVNSRLKGQRALNCIRVRRRAKVTLHCYLSLVALQASAAKCG